jgi:hypothetical protein
MKKHDKVILECLVLLLKSLKQTNAVKKQTQKAEKLIKWGDAYDPERDWWPNKYPDM